MAAAGGALFFKYQCLYIGRSDSTTVEHCTDFLCSWNNPACLSDPVMERLAMAVLIFYVLAFLSGGIWTEVMGNTRTTGVIFVLCALGPIWESAL